MPATLAPVCPDDLAELDQVLDGLCCRECRRHFSSNDGIPDLLPRSSYEHSTDEKTQLDNYQASFSSRSERTWYRPLRLTINMLGNQFLYTWARRTLGRVLAIWPASVLDAACGDGILRRYLSKQCLYTGIDFSQRMLRRAQRYHPSTYYRADLTHLPFASATFDAVVSIQTLQYLQRPDVALAEIARTLKPSGTALISVPNYQCFKYRWLGLPQIELQRFDRERIMLLMSKNFDLQKLETQGFWIPVPRIPIHIPGVYSPARGLAWTIVACVRK